MKKGFRMFKQISEDFVVRTIQNYVEYTAVNQEEVRNLYSQLVLQRSQNHQEEIITTVSFGRSFMQIVSSGGSDVRDLTDIYDRVHALYMEDLKNTRLRIHHMFEVQSTMNRIMACYKSLSPSDEYLVLKYLYETNATYTEGLEEAQDKMNLSVPTIKRHRKKALSMIKKLYDSQWSNEEMLITTDAKNMVSYR